MLVSDRGAPYSEASYLKEGGSCMLKKALLAGVATIGLSLGMTLSASAHNALSVWEAPAGHSFPMTLNINHGCKGSPITGAIASIG